MKEPDNMIRCIAIDDEPLALEVIEKFCHRMGGVDLQAFSDPSRGLQAVMRDRPQVVFLDIDMGSQSGLEIAARLPQGTCFIFTTAYLDYALDGFELDAVDYLHKPFAYSRFQSAFSKALRRLGGAGPTEPSSIVVKQEYANVNIPLADILYVEAMEGYSKIYRAGGECTVSRVLLKNIGAMLPAGRFLRIHRSYIVPADKIVSFSRQELRLTNGVTLPIGRQYAAEIAAALSPK